MTPLVTMMCPTRGRPESLRRSIASLLDLADDPKRIEILLWVDDDDETRHLIPSGFRVFHGPRVGYARLNECFNAMSREAGGIWLGLWNDDAFMTTKGWDSILDRLTPNVLANPSSNWGKHDIDSTFPIIPRRWVELVGHFSLDGANDTWWQFVATINRTLKPVPIHVHHDRVDLTGGHNDRTSAERNYNPRTFWDPETQRRIAQDAEVIRCASA